MWRFSLVWLDSADYHKEKPRWKFGIDPTSSIRSSSGGCHSWRHISDISISLICFKFLRHIMRAILSARPKFSHRCVSRRETPLKRVEILTHATRRSTEQMSMRTKFLNMSRFKLFRRISYSSKPKSGKSNGGLSKCELGGQKGSYQGVISVGSKSDPVSLSAPL